MVLSIGNCVTIGRLTWCIFVLIGCLLIAIDHVKTSCEITLLIHNVFKQSIIFQKALTQIDISGPLHIALHVLQSIFIVYKDIMKSTQQVVS